MKNFISPEVLNKNRQELPIFYRLNGAIYLAYYDYLIKNHNFVGEKTFAYIMPKERSVDIDDEIDLNLCEILINKKI
jgi:N-acylneuraminate cytidylyltransferase/CMP-N,N'-diacetyllegionaminic acid synthase